MLQPDIEKINPEVVPIDLAPLNEICEDHHNAGKMLFAACDAELFPADALACAVLERSLNLIKGFRIILENGGYSSAVGLLRMQLDNILRFNGVILTTDPHEIACKIFSGERLSKIKDRSGAKMTDKRLVEILAKKNPWVTDVYALASGYIHLSKEHLFQFIYRSQLQLDGTRHFEIGDEEHYINKSYRKELLDSFIVVSRGVTKIVQQWTEFRHHHGTNAILKERFKKSI